LIWIMLGLASWIALAMGLAVLMGGAIRLGQELGVWKPAQAAQTTRVERERVGAAGVTHHVETVAAPPAGRRWAPLGLPRAD